MTRFLLGHPMLIVDEAGFPVCSIAVRRARDGGVHIDVTGNVPQHMTIAGEAAMICGASVHNRGGVLWRARYALASLVYLMFGAGRLYERATRAL